MVNNFNHTTNNGCIMPIQHPDDNLSRPNHPGVPHPPTPPNKPEKPGVHDGPFVIIVNGTDKPLPHHTRQLSYEDVVRLAYGKYDNSNSIIYSVVYSNGPNENPKGTLVKGDTVFVRKGMIFNVGCSNKS